MRDRPAIHLVPGGARSGKRRQAEALVLATGLSPVHVATAGDREMAARFSQAIERGFWQKRRNDVQEFPG